MLLLVTLFLLLLPSRFLQHHPTTRSRPLLPATLLHILLAWFAAVYAIQTTRQLVSYPSWFPVVGLPLQGGGMATLTLTCHLLVVAAMAGTCVGWYGQHTVGYGQQTVDGGGGGGDGQEGVGRGSGEGGRMVGQGQVLQPLLQFGRMLSMGRAVSGN